MSTDQAKKLAKQFIEDQKQILEAHGDKVVRSKCKDAIEGAQRTFEALSAASEKLAARHLK
jgi:hypothetical protein